MNPVVVITGASAGVGRATARLFASKGSRLALIARDEDSLAVTATEVNALGSKALTIPCDVADAEALERAADETEQKLGPIDVWINNAMVSVFSPAKEMTPEEFKRVTEVTYLGYVYGTKAALKRMIPRDRGRIIQVGSALAYRGIPLQSAYCGAKHAIQGFTESVRCELLHDRSNVKITMVQLPALNTPQFEWVRSRLSKHPRPVPPIYQPEVAARAIWWSSRHYRRELNVGLVTSMTIAADKLFPGLLDRYLGRTGYRSQVDDRPPEPGRQDNLWQPGSAEFGAHGDFDSVSKNRSLQLWLSTHRKALLTGAGALAAVALVKCAEDR